MAKNAVYLNPWRQSHVIYINIIETQGWTFDLGQQHPNNKFGNLFLQYKSNFHYENSTQVSRLCPEKHS